MAIIVSSKLRNANFVTKPTMSNSFKNIKNSVLKDHSLAQTRDVRLYFLLMLFPTIKNNVSLNSLIASGARRPSNDLIYRLIAITVRQDY